jgi:dephospho-CoA kinase
VIDADIIARELVLPGTPALHEIVATFGKEVLDPAGALDRRAMRERVFAQPEARRALEAILHPLVRRVLQERAALASLYAIIVVPLLVENRQDYAWVDRVLVVDVARETQRSRLVQRDRIDGELADTMLDAQASRAQRLEAADDIIMNEGTPQDLDSPVRLLHARYEQMAAVKAGISPA